MSENRKTLRAPARIGKLSIQKSVLFKSSSTVTL